MQREASGNSCKPWQSPDQSKQRHEPSCSACWICRCLSITACYHSWTENTCWVSECSKQPGEQEEYHSAAPQGLLGPLNGHCCREGPDPQLVGADPTAPAIAAFMLAPVQGLYSYGPAGNLLVTSSLCQVEAEEQNEEVIHWNLYCVRDFPREPAQERHCLPRKVPH